MKEEKGITLVALVITIVVLIIIASVSITNGNQSIEDTKLKEFYSQLDIIQKRVDDIATTNESYFNSEGNEVNIKTAGSELTQEQKNLLDTIISDKNLETLSNNFRYFTKEELASILDLKNIDYDVFIDFDNRIVVSEQGITKNGIRYYVLENSTYLVKQNTTKNEGNISLNYTVSEYVAGKYRVTVVPTIVGDVKDNR